MSIEVLRQRYEAAGQGHLLQFWSQLPESERTQLQAQLEALDVERINRIYKKSVGAEKGAAEQAGREVIEPLPVKPRAVTLRYMGDGTLRLKGEVRVRTPFCSSASAADSH